jgi:asparagine synthase (glutamine-hydrolysing)
VCGINGAFAYGPGAAAPDEALLVRVRDRMQARGPDGHGLWLSPDRRVGFGHRRLAIIDLSPLGAQPMSTEDGRFTVTFNGEIYNYRELRRELEAAGVRFHSHSDTEVLLHLYRRDGADMVRHLRGMFAFALWDAAERTMFLARDRYGIKPLYYADVKGTLHFASQVRPLLEAGVGGELDSGGVAGFLLWGSVPEPLTLFAGVRLLPAGSTLTLKEGEAPLPSRYWTIEEALRQSAQEASSVAAGTEGDYVREALVDSVNAHMVADVPVGAFLSAGLDSSAIVGLARRAAGAAIRTITISFEEFKGDPLDELPLATEIARFLQVEHQGIRLSLAEVERDLPNFLDAMDQPTIDGMNTWLVSKAAAAAGLKVALSGLGGDELLGSYSTFRRVPQILEQVRSRARPPWFGRAYRALHTAASPFLTRLDPARAGLYELGGTAAGAYRICRGLFMPWELPQVIDADLAREGLRRLAESRAEEADVDGLDPFAEVVALESSRYMRNQLLRDTDWVSMAHSLEIRVPLVDHELTRRVAGLAMGGRLGDAKKALPAALDPPLPAHIVNKPKTGFTVPLWRWLRKSPDLAAWKQCAPLARANSHDYRRLAYCLLHRQAGLRPHLRA